jgi:hypothetical protein
MKSISVRLACFTLFTAIFTAVLLSSGPTGRVRAGLEEAVHRQDATGYPELPTEAGYIPPPEIPTPTPSISPTPGGPSITPGGPTPTLPGFITPTLNPLTPSPTIGRDLFGTEDSEIGNARVTPPPSETPEPRLTSTLSPSGTPMPGFLQGFNLNRGLFIGGFLLPLGIALLAWLGYRLAHTGEFSGKKPD